ncbi:MAG: DUF1289 domain-containing protein [Burkholderiaceae bacterium]|jgi:predicted Fe-S protein YdhL (DUF1289 family)
MTIEKTGYSNSSLEPESPCIGYCSTSFGDEICLGCGRSAMEVINWITLSDEQKQEIWARITAEGKAIRFRKT